ncbi:FKBP-type peptidyl-prolyl cis-trans isomerase [Prolixibacteraceae bacterium Z1-6]|uniref:Peptidyl-prolyl cis-trans isomerase n=1 Tax=Draconibacterium aestuarii TaxID=2998507 RepID=A0A9X3FCX5_9BACT|nr:FKBP-type peptidyl-prolyl cis-trans isomerase [Prolixibacteraceae bacterium Z1-6]
MLKSISYTAVLSMLLITSCLTDETDTRTYEQEMIELDVLIQSIIAEGTVVDTTDLGVYYIIEEEGEGDFAQVGDTISIEYAGYLTDGNIFDISSDYYEDGIWEFVYGEQSLITGFDDALSLMRVNREAEFIIPSTLAYGAYGYGSIGSYQTSIFVIKMHDLKPVQDQ